MSCSVCRDGRAKRINRSIAEAGVSATARKFGLARATLNRHKANCAIDWEAVAAQAEQSVAVKPIHSQLANNEMPKLTPEFVAWAKKELESPEHQAWLARPDTQEWLRNRQAGEQCPSS